MFLWIQAFTTSLQLKNLTKVLFATHSIRKVPAQHAHHSVPHYFQMNVTFIWGFHAAAFFMLWFTNVIWSLHSFNGRHSEPAPVNAPVLRSLTLHPLSRSLWRHQRDPGQRQRLVQHHHGRHFGSGKWGEDI